MQTEKPKLDLNRATSLTSDVVEAIADQYRYHPWDEIQQARGETVRAAISGAAAAIIANVPPSADRSVALRNLREARMNANSAITHAGKY